MEPPKKGQYGDSHFVPSREVVLFRRSIKREPDNAHDLHAVVVYYGNCVVGHVPYNLAPTLSAFLRREVNKGFAIVAGDKVNRGAGYGLEIPCTYRLYGGNT